jgi:hypothetical protein
LGRTLAGVRVTGEQRRQPTRPSTRPLTAPWMAECDPSSLAGGRHTAGVALAVTWGRRYLACTMRSRNAASTRRKRRARRHSLSACIFAAPLFRNHASATAESALAHAPSSPSRTRIPAPCHFCLRLPLRGRDQIREGAGPMRHLLISHQWSTPFPPAQPGSSCAPGRGRGREREREREKQRKRTRKYPRLNPDQQSLIRMGSPPRLRVLHFLYDVGSRCHRRRVSKRRYYCTVEGKRLAHTH